jgi:hypothetical protein
MTSETRVDANGFVLPVGWALYTVDCSCEVSGRSKHIIVCIRRDQDGLEWFMGLDEERREVERLYVYTEAPTIQQAIDKAALIVDTKVSNGEESDIAGEA